jgi:hypothetical protein
MPATLQLLTSCTSGTIQHREHRTKLELSAAHDASDCTIADRFARIHDTEFYEFYDYTSSGGDNESGGGPKTLKDSI